MFACLARDVRVLGMWRSRAWLVTSRMSGVDVRVLGSLHERRCSRAWQPLAHLRMRALALGIFLWGLCLDLQRMDAAGGGHGKRVFRVRATCTHRGKTDATAPPNTEEGTTGHKQKAHRHMDILVVHAALHLLC